MVSIIPGTVNKMLHFKNIFSCMIQPTNKNGTKGYIAILSTSIIRTAKNLRLLCNKDYSMNQLIQL